MARATTLAFAISALLIIFTTSSPTAAYTPNEQYVIDNCASAPWVELCHEMLLPHADAISGKPANLSQAAISVAYSHDKSGMEIVSEALKNETRPEWKELLEYCQKAFVYGKNCMEYADHYAGLMSFTKGFEVAFELQEVKMLVHKAQNATRSCHGRFNGTSDFPEVRDWAELTGLVLDNVDALVKYK